jgi:hypothetical protein
VHNSMYNFMGDVRTAYKIFIGKSEGKRPL